MSDKCPHCGSPHLEPSLAIHKATYCRTCHSHFGAVDTSTIVDSKPPMWVNDLVLKEADTNTQSAILSGPMSQATAGVKHDQNKPAMQYIPKSAMWVMGLAFGYGANKYGAWNFKNGLAVCRCLAAAVRHIYQFLAGENTDPESGVSHLGHAMASIAMAIDMVENHPELDDRFKAS